MRFLLALALAATAAGQTSSGEPSAIDLAARMLQLMESTAVAVPGLVHASEALRQNGEATLASLRRTPQDAGLTYQFIGQVRAYLALSDSIPRPSPFPRTADQQFSELRDSLSRVQQRFGDILQTGNRQTQAHDADPDDLKRYAEEDSKLLPSAKSSRVVFLGDSITEGWRLNEYFTGRDFINRGIGAQTTLQMLGRFMQDVVNLHPKAVLILGGINDIANGVAVHGIEDHLTMMGDLAKAHGIKPLFGSILPVSDYHKDSDPLFEMTKTHPPEAITQVNAWLQDYCRREGFTFVNYYSGMVDSAGHLIGDLADDGLHPNSKGYRVMSPIVLEAVGRILSTADQTVNPPPAKRRFGLLTK